jgi:hypothetical protein
MNSGDEFLLTCKKNYLDKVTPSNAESKSKKGYLRLIEIAKEYFRNNKYKTFAGFFQEGQYFIALWAAHLILEYGNADHELKLAALKIIKDYSENPLAPDVALEEKKWLDTNSHKY